MSQRNRKTNRLEHWQIVTALLILYDIIAIIGSYFLALWIRFDIDMFHGQLDHLMESA